MMIANQIIKKQRMIIILLSIFIVMTLLIRLGLGTSSLSFERLFWILLGQGDFKENFIVFSLRMPRVIIVFLSGIALALSGSILQSITKNDLADPGILGINAGAGVGVAIFYLFIPTTGSLIIYVLPLISFISAFLVAVFIYFCSYQKTKGIHPLRLLLTGVGFSMALSGVMVLIFSSVDPFKVDFIANWLAGDIWGADWPFILAFVPWLLVLIPLTIYKSNQLNLLSLSEQQAIGVGVSLEKERLILLFIAVALAAAAVSVTGAIAFVGLIAPHIAKTLVGPRHQLYLPIAMLVGGWFLLFADTVGRNLLLPSGIPTGIMVALIGAPYFMYLLRKPTR
jgi:iron complex transport system permease protein